jgi:hypothetical protein
MILRAGVLVTTDTKASSNASAKMRISLETGLRTAGLYKSTNEQYIHRVERGRVNRKIKKEPGDPKGIGLRLFCPFAETTTSFFVHLPRQDHGDVAVPLVSSTSSCCASNPPQAGPLAKPTGKNPKHTQKPEPKPTAKWD